MNVTVNTPFLKRTTLRELAHYFYQGRLSREDYVKCRTHLIDHLCHLDAQLDPVVQMLLRAAEKNPGDTSEITAPQSASSPVASPVAADTTRVMGARTIPAAVPRKAAVAPPPVAETKSNDTVMVVVAAVAVVVLLGTAALWFFLK